jgi:hypothetical protein
MRYFVITDQGEEFGPYDLGDLNLWIADGRILPTTILMQESGSMKVAASMVEGLNWREGQTFDAYTAQKITDGKSEFRASWACFAGSLILCCLPIGFHVLSGAIGTWTGFQAYRKHHSGALVPAILNILLLITSLIGFFTFKSFDPQQFTKSIPIQRMLRGR